jgi:hypothetical protein
MGANGVKMQHMGMGIGMKNDTVSLAGVSDRHKLRGHRHKTRRRLQSAATLPAVLFSSNISASIRSRVSIPSGGRTNASIKDHADDTFRADGSSTASAARFSTITPSVASTMAATNASVAKKTSVSTSSPLQSRVMELMPTAVDEFSVGLFAGQIEALLKLFPADQVQILFQEEMYRSASAWTLASSTRG